MIGKATHKAIINIVLKRWNIFTLFSGKNWYKIIPEKITSAITLAVSVSFIRDIRIIGLSLLEYFAPVFW